MANAKEDESRMQICEVDENGYVWLNTTDGKGQYLVEGWAYDTGVEVVNTIESDGTREDTAVLTLTKNEDGTFTYKYYVPCTE
jgi:ligand-binding sensor domain-containing protein